MFRGTLTAGTISTGVIIVGTDAAIVESGAAANLPSDDNLVAYWNFDEGTGSVAADGSEKG